MLSNRRSITKSSFKMEIIRKDIDIEAEIHDFDLQKAISVSVNSNSLQDLLIPLIILRESLVDIIEIALNNFSILLKHNREDNISVCSSFSVDNRNFKASISTNSLEFGIYYLLKYYRDTAAEMDHIDLDFEYINDSVITLVIKANESKEISPSEMNKLLGL